MLVHATPFQAVLQAKIVLIAGSRMFSCKAVYLSLRAPADIVSALCRTALHLQLTTELVTAAAAAGAEGVATESMWQRTGALAIQDAAAWALELLAALSGCGFERPSGEASACPHLHCIAPCS